MELNQPIGSKMPSQEHLNFINKLNDAKIPRQSQLIANRLFMKNFPREVRKTKVKTRLKISFIYLFEKRNQMRKEDDKMNQFGFNQSINAIILHCYFKT